MPYEATVDTCLLSRMAEVLFFEDCEYWSSWFYDAVHEDCDRENLGMFDLVSMIDPPARRHLEELYASRPASGWQATFKTVRARSIANSSSALQK